MRRASTTAVFLVLGLGLLHALAYVSGTVAPDPDTRQHQDRQQQVRRVLDRAEGITALSVGSSHSRAIDFDALGEEGFHLWRGGSDLFEAAYLAGTLAPRLPALETVYVSVSYTSFAADNATDEERATIRRQVYFSVPSYEWIAGDAESFVRAKLRRLVPVEAVVRADNWSRVVNRVVLSGPPGTPVPRDRFGQMADARYRDCTSLPPDELRRHATSRATHHARLHDEMTASRPDVAEHAEAALARLVTDLDARGVRVVLYTPPYSPAYTDQVADRLKQRSRQAAARVASARGAHHVDLSEDPRFTQDPAVFMNSDHLNACGARAFSRGLRDALRQAAAPT